MDMAQTPKQGIMKEPKKTLFDDEIQSKELAGSIELSREHEIHNPLMRRVTNRDSKLTANSAITTPQ